MFYYEKKNMFGKWMPRTSADRPSGHSVNGGREEIRNVQEIPMAMEGQTLGALERYFNAPKPEFAMSQVEVNEDLFDADFWLKDDDQTVSLLSDSAADLLRRLEDSDRMTIGDGQEAARLIRHLSDPAHFITALAKQVHEDNVRAGWWTDLKTGEDLHGKRNVPEMLMLIVSEVSEAMEGHRKRLMDDKLPHRPMLRVELIDAMIRMLDILGSQDNEEHPAGLIFQEKRAYNAQRADHKPEARLAAGGKAF